MLAILSRKSRRDLKLVESLRRDYNQGNIGSIMEKSTLKMWLQSLGEAWESLNPKAAVNLFDDQVVYYESSLTPPHQGKDAIAKLWAAIPHNQKEVSFVFKILIEQNNEAVANWHVTRTKLPNHEHETINGIFHFKLNQLGKCVYFNQWRTSQID